MKKNFRLFGALLLLLSVTACDKEEEGQVTPSAPSYEFVSVEYDALGTEPLEGLWIRSTFKNGTDRECGASCASEDPAEFSSRFESDVFSADGFPDWKVPLPRVDAGGCFAGLTEQTFPLNGGDWYSWKVPASFSQAYRVPARSTVQEYITECGFRIWADFRMKMRNRENGETVMVCGTWSGRQITCRTVRVEYENRDAVEWDHPVIWQ